MNSLAGCGATPPLPARAQASTETAGASGARAATGTHAAGGGSAHAPATLGSTGGGTADAAAGAATLGQTNEMSSVLARLVDVLKGLVAAIQSKVGAAGGGPVKGGGCGGGSEVDGAAGGGPGQLPTQSPTQSALQSQLISGSQRPTQVGAAGGGPAPTSGTRTPANWGSGSGNGVTDPVLAEKWFQHIRSSVVSRFGDVDQALAAGYVRNPSSGEYPIHYINNQVFRTADGSDVTMPATLMYERDKSGRQVLVGVMLSHDFNKPMPYFGAGQWHRHPGDPQANMHVFFDKTVQGGAFEMEMGVV